MTEKYKSIRTVMDELSVYKPCSRYHLSRFCSDGIIPAIKEDDCWLISNDFINAAIEWREKVISLSQILDEKVIEYGLQNHEKSYRRNVRAKLQHLLFKPNNIYMRLFCGPFISAEKTNEALRILEEEKTNIEHKLLMLPVSCAATKLGLSVYQTKKLIKTGQLTAERVNHDLYVPPDEITKYKTRIAEYIGIFDFLNENFSNESTFFEINNRCNRWMLNQFLRKSPLADSLITWQEAGVHGDRRNSYYFPAVLHDEMFELLQKYLRNYGFQDEKLSRILDDAYWNTHKDNLEILEAFAEGKKVSAMLVVAEIIIETVPGKLTDMTNSEADHFIDVAISKEIKAYVFFAAKFLNYLQLNYDCRFNMGITLLKQKVDSLDNVAPYPEDKFYQLAYMTFDDEFIRTERLIEKSVQCYETAITWLFVIWQFCTAWRIPDFWRIPVLKLFSEKNDIKRKIENGTYKEEAILVCEMLECDINDGKMLPSKTKDEQNDCHLVISFPESLKDLIGTVYSICCIHTEEHFKRISFNTSKYVKLFGEKYYWVFGSNALSARRLNKSYLTAIKDLIEEETDSQSKLKAYWTTSYIRAHVNSKYKISDTTAIYLTHTLDGLTVDEVLVMLFEAGTLSMVPYLLLQVIYGKDYLKLPAKDQNELIKAFDMGAYEIENLLTNTRTIFWKVKSLVENLFEAGISDIERKKLAKKILNNIIFFRAPSKSNGIQCVMTACYRPCPYPKRTHCFGCDNSIAYKSMLKAFVRELENMAAKYNSAVTEGEKAKYNAVIMDNYYSSCVEIITMLKTKYGPDAVKDFQEKISIAFKGGLLDASNDTD